MTTLHDIKASIIGTTGIVVTGVNFEAGIYYFGGFLTGVVVTLLIRKCYAAKQ